MSKLPLQKGVRETRSNGLRYILPDQLEVALTDLKLKGLLDLLSKIIEAPDRPIGLLPSLVEVVQILMETIHLCMSSISEEHPVFPRPNPEITSTGQISPSIETKSGARGHMAVVTPGTGEPRTLGLSPRDEADEVTIVYNPNAGRPESTSRTPPRALQAGKEPIPFYRFLEVLQTVLVEFAASPLAPGPLRAFGYLADVAQRVIPMVSQGGPPNANPKLGNKGLTIAKLASLARRQRRALNAKANKGTSKKSRR